MAVKTLGLAQLPTLNPDKEEQSRFDKAILRVINNNFRLISNAMGTFNNLVTNATAPPPQFYSGTISSGTATTLTSVITQNNILTAPMDLTMIVLCAGDAGANGAPNTTFLRIQDEGGLDTLVGGSVLSAGEITIKAVNGDERRPWTIVGKKDYTAGQICGFRLLYRVSGSNIYIGAGVTVTFHPR